MLYEARPNPSRPRLPLDKVLVYGGDESYERSDGRVLSWRHVDRALL